ncbi:hypothetical protein F4861DRAFT_325960 [Xylaria intraflava]|nr:hypothetical protein F4861DRAFT_325960 [Xylaria intraflava]
MSPNPLVDPREGPELPDSSRARGSVDLQLSAGAALVSGSIAYYLASQQCELASELVCWVCLPTLFSVGRAQPQRGTEKRAMALPSVNRLPESSGSGNTSDLSLWLVALGITTCSVFKAETGIVVALLPALTPMLAIGHKYLRPGVPLPAVSSTSPFSPFTESISGFTLASIFAIITLSEWDLFAYGISAVPVVFLFVAYMLLTPQANKHSWFRGIDFTTTVRPLSFRIAFILVIILGTETYLFGFPNISPMGTVIVGLAKALAWYFASQLAHYSWLAASLTGTFSLLASRDPFAQQTDTRALMNVVASLIVLGQTICLLPNSAKPRLKLWVVALVPVLPYLANLAAIRAQQSSTIVHTGKHPVEALVKEANSHFNSMLQNQSTTYATAHAEYQRRYGFEPPPGFKNWYQFAQSHRSPIIDEFGIISEGIRPFLRLSGKEILETMSQIYNAPGHELWSCTMSGPLAKTKCSHHSRTNDRHNAAFFDNITASLPVQLDLKFLLNHLDEPAVIIPPPSQEPSKPKISNLRRQPAYGELTKFCPSGQSKTNREGRQLETYGLPFVTDRKSTMDVCTHAEYGDMHGLFLAPESLRLTEGLVPVLSNGAPNVFGDILYPSTAYMEERFRYHSTNDVDWDVKQNNLYWAGSTTGGYGSKTSWRNLHRQRFVTLAQNLVPARSRSYSYLQEKNGDGEITLATTPFLNSRHYDVGFARTLQCDAEACNAERKHFKRKPWVSGDRPFQSRLVFDLDGNGISGRYYKLLASKSAPLKQTLFREWHDDRLVPWVHYIPVSQGMEELPELVFYLTSTPSGRQRAKEIAEQGRRWFAEAFREVDVAIYMYRLFLELARLQDPERPAWEIAGAE